MEGHILKKNDDQEWDFVIKTSGSKLSLNLHEIWAYRDLLVLFVKRDIVTVYKQTILGPIWFLLQPVFTTLTYVLIFGKMGNMADKAVPSILFYMGSVTLWNYFSDTLNTTAKTFTDNATVFGKVYFPRIILPLSKVISGIIKFFIQFGLFLLTLAYYVFASSKVHPNVYALLCPLLLLMMSLLSLGFGLLITSMTTKYRDLTFLITFGIQLWMFATPVIYPVSKYPKYEMWIFLNPLTSIFEAFKYGFLGSGVLSFQWLGYSALVTFVVLMIGIAVFNKVERRFIDTV